MNVSGPEFQNTHSTGNRMKRINSRPPIIPSLILSMFHHFSNDFYLLGDLDEEYYELLKTQGYLFAKKWYWRNFLKIFPSLILESFFRSEAMIRNYLKIAVRNIVKNKSTSFVNIAGLSLGMACAILIFLWVENQTSYDQSQTKKDNIYRLENETWVVMPPTITDVLPVFPEIKESVRFYMFWSPTIKYDENIFTLQNLALCDSNVFKVFDFDFILGDPNKSLINPNSIVLTESMANKLFGDEYPLGQKVMLTNDFEYTVTAVIRDVKKLHVDINALVSVTDMTRHEGNNNFLRSNASNFLTYLLLSPGVDIDKLEEKINQRARNEFNYTSKDDLLLRPFDDIYFNTDLQYEGNVKHGNIKMIIVFSVIALLILSIACINFINLTISTTTKRGKEIAVRKVIGARQSSIQIQFFGETLVTVLISFILALIVAFTALPVFSELTNEQITLSSLDSGIIPMLLGILIFTTLVSAAYPAFYLAALKPVTILKGKNGTGKKENLFSKVLISFQFAISIFLIISTITVVEQLHFMQNTDLGFKNDQILTVTLRGKTFEGEQENMLNAKSSFKNALMRIPDVKNVTYLHQIPGNISNTWSWKLKGTDELVALRVFEADPSFVEFYGLEIIKGRNFSADLSTDLNQKFIINETACKALNLSDPVGYNLDRGYGEIIGVMKDFHFNSLHTKIEPAVVRWSHWQHIACIKITGGNLKEAISNVENVYSEFCPGYGFEYSFADEIFAAKYEKEQKLEMLLSYFVGLAICLSCLGLFALTAFMAEKRTKEIGIRKVLGASDSLIVFLLSRSFVTWIIIANLIAWPAAYFVLDEWLQNFAYHISPNPFVFIGGTLSALIVASLTILYQALKAASKNPVVTLKAE